MKDKYIFLDKDGVLNHHRFYHDYLVKSKKQDKWWEESVDKNTILLINELIANTGAKIVLSASSRSDFPNSEAATDYYRDLGLIGEIVDRTPHIGICNRGQEVEKWLKDKGFSYEYWHKTNTEQSMIDSGVFSYVIIDDDADFLYTQRNHVVQVEQIKCKSGFNRNHLKRATRILNTSIMDLDF